MNLSRRQILQHVSAGFGYLAFAGLAVSRRRKTNRLLRTSNPLAPKQPHFAARAKRVIFLCMQGGPSHVDTFDYKPQLAKDHGKRGKYGGSLLKSPWEFRQRGESGLWISDLFPQVAEHADELCLIRSMQCDQPVHPGAMTQMHTGTAQFIRPSLGAWTLVWVGDRKRQLAGIRFTQSTGRQFAITMAAHFCRRFMVVRKWVAAVARRGSPAAAVANRFPISRIPSFPTHSSEASWISFKRSIATSCGVNSINRASKA